VKGVEMVAIAARTLTQGAARLGPQQPDHSDLLTTWTERVTSKQAAALREILLGEFTAVEYPGVPLDVRRVTEIDRSGIELAIGADHRGAATGRRLVLIDSGVPVTGQLQRMHLIPEVHHQPGDRRLSSPPPCRADAG